jgi:hypothetical protein
VPPRCTSGSRRRRTAGPATTGWTPDGARSCWRPISDYLNVDSLAYLELGRLTHATGAPADAFCTACLSGHYPVPVPEVGFDAKLVLEADVVDLTAGGSLGGKLEDGLEESPTA